MFTGIVGDIGEIKRREEKNGILSADILSHDNPLSIDLGASIACDGVCLTVTHVEAINDGALFSVDISKETLDVTNLGGWSVGQAINIERSMRIGEEIGGHIVSGHVDGLAQLIAVEKSDENTVMQFRAPEELAKFIASKGSVALNGTSLTVNRVEGCDFWVNLIPYTVEVTTWSRAQEGQEVNLEVDMMARYVARLREFD